MHLRLTNGPPEFDGEGGRCPQSRSPPRDYGEGMSDPGAAAEPEWPTHCPVCGTALSSAVIDFDKTNADRAEMQPGEMAAVDYCPNSDCPSRDASRHQEMP